MHSMHCFFYQVFFRAGVLGRLEEVREDRIGMLMTWLQSVIRGWATRKYYAKLQKQRTALLVVQRNIRKYKIMAQWPWYAMWIGLRPKLSGAVQGEEELNRLEEDAIAAEGIDYLKTINRDRKVIGQKPAA